MERFKVLGSESGQHDSAIWALAPLPESQRADNGAFVTGGEDGCLRTWRFGSGNSSATSSPASSDGDDSDGGDGDGEEKRQRKRRGGTNNGVASRLRTLKRHALPVVRVAVAADAPVAASTSLDGHVHIWDLGAGADAAPNKLPQAGVTDAWDVALFPDGTRAVVCGAHATVQIVDCEGGGMMEKHYLSGGDVDAAAGKGGAGGGGAGGAGGGAGAGGTNRKDDARSGGGGGGGGAMAMAVALNEDASMAVAGFADGSLTLYDIAAGRAVTSTKRRHGGPVRSVAFVPGERGSVVSASDDQLLNLYDMTASGAPGGGGETTGTCRGHEANVFCVAASPDGRYLASGGADNTVRVWDRGMREQVFVHSGHTQSVWGMAFVGGERIVSTSDDGNICIIDSSNADRVTG